MKKRFSILLSLIMLSIVFGILSCDKYNVVEPRFYSPEDVIDTPWFDSTYTSVMAKVQSAENCILSVKVVGQAGELIRVIAIRSVLANTEITAVWDLKDNDAQAVDEGVYGFVFAFGTVRDDYLTVDAFDEKEVWFDLNFHDNPAQGLNYIGDYPEEMRNFGGMVAYNNYLYVFCSRYTDQDSLNGILTINYTDPENPRLVSFTNVFSSVTYPEIKMEIDPGSNSLVFQYESTIHVYDISNPGQPENLNYRIYYAEDFCISDNKLYSLHTSGYKTIGITDLSSPAGPALIDSVVAEPYRYYQITVDSDLAALTFSDRDLGYGIVFFGIGDSSSAEILATYGTAIKFDDPELLGNCLYISEGYDQLSIIDVTVPSNPQYLKRLGYPAANIKINNNRMIAYTGQYVWLMDLSDSFNPAPIGFIDNLYRCSSVTVSDNLVFINYDIEGSYYTKIKIFSFISN